MRTVTQVRQYYRTKDKVESLINKGATAQDAELEIAIMRSLLQNGDLAQEDYDQFKEMMEAYIAARRRTHDD